MQTLPTNTGWSGLYSRLGDVLDPGARPFFWIFWARKKIVDTAAFFHAVEAWLNIGAYHLTLIKAHQLSGCRNITR